MVVLAVAVLVVFVGGLYFIAHNKHEEAVVLPTHPVRPGNGLPPKPEERWRYIKELENRQMGVTTPTEPTAGGQVESKTQLTPEQRQLLEQMQADMRQTPTQLSEVPYNDPNQATQAPARTQRQVQQQQPTYAQQQPVQTQPRQVQPTYTPQTQPVRAPQAQVQTQAVQPKPKNNGTGDRKDAVRGALVETDGSGISSYYQSNRMPATPNRCSSSLARDKRPHGEDRLYASRGAVPHGYLIARKQITGSRFAYLKITLMP